MGLITDDQLAQALAEQMGMQVVSLSDVVIPPEVLTHVTEPMAQLYRIIPLSFVDGTLTIAMCDPQKLSIVDEMAKNAPLGLMMAKLAINRGLDGTRYNGTLTEGDLAHMLWFSEDRAEGLKAFAEKRKPDYKGE